MPTREETQARMNIIAAGMMKHTPEQSYTVADRLEERAARQPDHPFLIHEGRTISYGEVNRQANRHAHCALAQGLRRGDVVALLMENRPEFLYLWFGLAKLGCVSALINTQISGDALRHALATTASQKLFVGAECLGRLDDTSDISGRMATYVVAEGEAKNLPDGCIALEPQLAGQPDDNPDPALRAGVIGQSTLCLVFTSGTTGRPKGVAYSHRALVLHSMMLSHVDGMALSEKDVEDLRFALGLSVDFVALSFVRSARDVRDVHKVMDEVGVHVPVIAKIEKPQALDELDDIVEAFDGIMVARGDLGVECPLEDVPVHQKLIIDRARRDAKPVIVATQML